MSDKELVFNLREITEEEWGKHEPPADADETFQESWGMSWHDPIRRAGGINHISIWRNRGVAEVWSWVAFEGEVVGKYQSLNLPVPAEDEDFPNWTLGGQSITTFSGRSCRMQNEYSMVGSDALVDLRYEAHTDPIFFDYNVEGSTWGAAHYESIGRVNGTVSVGGEASEVSGYAWQDHSWGERRWAGTLPHRDVKGEFGPDFWFSAIQLVTEAGPEPVPIGFVYEAGVLRKVERASYEARIGDDGHSPLGCNVTLWTTDGCGYHITGETHTSSPHTHLEGFWFTDGLTTFECGGRRGPGIFEVQELNGPTPWQRKQLGLDLPDALPEYYLASKK
jgi:hypothetical protein